MALIDLDKIIIKRTIEGIRCAECAGSLSYCPHKSVHSKIIRLVTFGAVKPKDYRCQACGKRYTMF